MKLEKLYFAVFGTGLLLAGLLWIVGSIFELLVIQTAAKVGFGFILLFALILPLGAAFAGFLLKKS